jgi:hypothetical protein
MAINWNQAEFVAPKLQIVPEQLPLEAGLKVGEVLQNRYDKAIETDTKIGALTKKLMGSVDPKDQELAKEITDTYAARLKDRATIGDYHKMQWQTLADAEDFANIYTGLTEKAKTMQKYRDYIDTNKEVVDPRIKAYQKAEWEKAQAKSTFDKENRFVSGLGVSAPSLVADTDFAKFADSFASGFKADSGGSKTGKTIFTKLGDKLPDGTISAGGAYNQINANKWEKVKDTDIIRALNDYAAASPGLQATIDRDTKASIYYEPLREGETLEQRKEMVKRDNMSRAWNAAANKFGYTSSYDEVENEYNTELNAALAAKNKVDADAPQWTQLPSAQFKQPGSKDLFGMNDKGELVYSSDKSKDRPFNTTNDILGGTGLGKNPQQTFEEYKKALTRPSVERTRIINHLTALGVIDKNADTKTINSAISNFWNRLANAESSITVAKPGNKAANDMLEEYNRTYFGTKTPDSKAKGTSILEGQLAQHTFINEQGKPMTPQQVAKETANRNVRVNGIVDQYKSPFEYGSSYMVASNDEGEQKHYLISPDLNTKNSGAYAANQIYNSINKQGLKSSWTDGQGINYEATPLEGGKRFVVYVNRDINNPIIIDEPTLNQLSQVTPGNVLPALQSLLKR